MIVFFFFLFDEDADTTVPVSVDDIDIDYNEELEYFFNGNVRKVWHKQKQDWYFSIVDVCQALTDSRRPRKYWDDLKKRLNEEGSQLSEKIGQLKMKAADGKMRKTDVANTEQLLRIIQSIPSKKAEPFKQWLAQIGRERLEEIADPELAYERMIATYRAKGYSEEWIKKRLGGIASRNLLTAEWHRSGVTDSKEYAALTNVMTHAWSGKTVKSYKEYKGLRKEKLRDNMTDIELALNQLAEISVTALSKVKNPDGFDESKLIAHDGGSIAGNARKELEKKLGRKVISPLNAKNPGLLNDCKHE